MAIPDFLPKDHKPDYRRLEKALTRTGLPDRVPFYELFIEDTMVERMTGRKCTAESEVELYYKLGHDYCNFSPEMGLSQTDCLKVDDTGANNKGGKREWLNSNDGLITGRREFDAYPWPKTGPDCCSRFQKYEGILPEGMKIVIRPVGVFENVRRLMGMVPLSYALYDDESLIEDIFYKVGSTIYGAVKYTFENVNLKNVFACVMGDDLAGGSGPLVSPDVYRKYVFPWMKLTAELAHSYGMPFGLHSCGNNEAIMEELICDIGLDAKHSFQDNVIPVVEFKKKYGDRLAVLGGIDMDKLARLEHEEFRSYCKNVLEACMTGGGYALGTGNSPATYIDLNNFYMMHQLVFKYGRY